MKKLRFVIAILLALSFVPDLVSAQANYEDVVYLKDGSILHGMIIEQVPNESLKIQTHDGNVFAYKLEEVEKITKERRQYGMGWDEPGDNPLGYMNISELFFGVGISEGSHGNNIGIQTVNGFRLNQHFSAGIGIGFYINDGSYYLPLFADFRGYLSGNKIVPFISTGIGYSFGLDHYDEGGFLVNPAVGIRFQLPSKTAMDFSLGYTYQQLIYHYNYFYSEYYRESEEFLNFRIGFTF